MRAKSRNGWDVAPNPFCVSVFAATSKGMQSCLGSVQLEKHQRPQDMLGLSTLVDPTSLAMAPQSHTDAGGSIEQISEGSQKVLALHCLRLPAKDSLAQKGKVCSSDPVGVEWHHDEQNEQDEPKKIHSIQGWAKVI